MGFLTIARARRASRKAKKTRKVEDWVQAADAWGSIVRIAPRSSRAWLQYAHALRQSSRSEAAAEAYRRVIALEPEAAGAWGGLGIALKARGLRSAAIDAFVTALRIDPMAQAARNELLQYGARGRLPEPMHGHAAIADALEGMRLALRQVTEWRDDFERAGIFPEKDYDAFRKQMSITAPPEQVEFSVLVRVDARAASPASLRATLHSLLRQSHTGWVAQVFADADMSRHPVGSLAYVEARIAFASEKDDGDADWVLHIHAGTVLAPEALGWFLWTASQTGCVAAYCDQDHVRQDWKHGPAFSNPVLHPVYDPYWFMDPAVAPIALLTAGNPDEHGAGLITRVAMTGPVAHIPLVLAARMAPASDVTPWMPALGPADGRTSLAVVIPTRDNPDLLRLCVESLLARASNPGRVEILLVSNRSEKAETQLLLAELESRAMTRVLNFDEPFNWSRANNIAARQSDAEILLFLNDDTEMLSERWDDCLEQILTGDESIGVVGASLFYPSGGIQHAGIVMGLEGDGPQHEARWQDAEAAGPNGRWQRLHLASAITGAFMAMPHALFDQLGGFDELNFAIAYNDIDMCLRVREAKRSVLYDPRLQLLHHESISRGASLTPDKHEWDGGELESLHLRWGQECLRDPGYNPQYAQRGYPFDGYRQPMRDEITDYIRRSARKYPWTTTRIDGA